MTNSTSVSPPRRRRRPIRVLVIAGVASLVAACVVVGLAMFVLRPAFLKPRLERALSDHLGLETTLEHLSVTLLPRPRAIGTGLVIRVPNRADLPPFITIDHFEVSIGPFSVLRRHVGVVHVGGLKIVVPPGAARRELAHATAPVDEPGVPVERSHVIVDRFEAHDASLTFSGSKPGKRPLLFDIPSLTMHELGFTAPFQYDAEVINPIPHGLVRARGNIGPWNAADPTSTAMDGTFTFTDAALATINGIGGTLQSAGSFKGMLSAILVNGDADIPDFNLDLGGKPAPLVAKYDVMVDGTDGTTTLRRVDARLVKTPLVVTGAITNLPGPGRHDVQIVADVPNGRLEDLLALAIDAPKPPLTGDVRLHATVSLPPGKTRARDRIALSGSFGLGQARFTNEDVQAKLVELSRRGQGLDRDEPMSRVMTSLKGQFVMKDGMLTMRDLGFEVPGAKVALTGTYDLNGEALDFHGTLRMPAPASKALGGFKSIFVRPFDRMLRKNGVTELPIAITGPRTDPKFGLEIGKVFKR